MTRQMTVDAFNDGRLDILITTDAAGETSIFTIVAGS